jgi:hypothetical protein
LAEAPTPLQCFERCGQFESGDARDGREVSLWHEPGDFQDEFVSGREQAHGLGKLSFSIGLHKAWGVDQWFDGLVGLGVIACWKGAVAG